MGISFDILAIQATHGIVYGMLLFMVASGFTLVWGMMGVLNMAHTAFFMLGAYLAYLLTVQVGNFWISLLISPIVIGFLGMVTERFLLQALRKRRGAHGAEMLVTFGLFYLIAEFILLIWGTVPLTVPPPKFLSGNIPFLGKTYPLYRLFILGCSAGILFALAWLLIRTRIGILIRAAVSDGEMVDALGTNVPILFRWVFGVGAALAGMAGVIAAPFFSAYPNMGMDTMLDCFVVVVVGGFGSLLGAFVAALMVGELQSFGVLWIPRLALVFQFLLLAVVLIIRPAGLFGEKE